MRIYLDYASVTPIDARVLAEMKKYSSHAFANPSALHKEGVAAKNALENARARVSEFLNAHPREIVFTSGGTEANNMALKGVLNAVRADAKKCHIIISAIEHSSVMETANELAKSGVEVTRLNVNEEGLISLRDLENAIRPETVLVSIMTVNNEVGSIEPIRDIMKVIRGAKKKFGSKYPLFHTDAAQAPVFLDLNVEKMGIDLLTLDGSKVYGPRGIGCIYIRQGARVSSTVPIMPIMHGGGQEFGLRSGTENIPAIAGFAKALELAKKERVAEAKRLVNLRGNMIAGLRKINPKIKVNGAHLEANYEAKNEVQAPHILNISIPGIDGEYFLFQLDANGIACSTKSSCLKDEDESYVLKAMGAHSGSSIRFSFGRETKESDVKKALLAISGILC